MKFLITVVIALNIHYTWSANEHLIYKTNTVPSNKNLWPTLGNGYLGFQVFHDSIHISNLFNGEGSSSHRARIPNLMNIQFEHCHIGAPQANCTFSLNMMDGVFRVEYATNEYKIEQLIYPHRYFGRTIVNEIDITILREEFTSQLNLLRETVATSSDIDFEEREEVVNSRGSVIEGYWYQCGKIKNHENVDLQEEQSNVCVYYSAVPISLDITEMGDMKILYFMVVDTDKNTALTEFESVYRSTGTLMTNIYETHSYEWTNFWMDHQFEILGNTELSQATHASLFAIANTMPALDITTSNYLGFSPLGLGNYYDLGLTTYEVDLFLTPTLAIIEHSWSDYIIQYRKLSIDAAISIAQNLGLNGAKFPARSGFTGIELSDKNDEIRYQIHVTANAAFAVKSHLMASYKLGNMIDSGCAVAVETAKYWDSLIAFNEEIGQFEIKSVTGLDESYTRISNDLTTNILAAYSLYFGDFMKCLCGEVLNINEYKQLDTDGFREKAKFLKIPYSTEDETYLPFEGHSSGNTLKISAPNLLDSLIPYTISSKHRENNLKFTESILIDNPRPMDYAYSAIHYLRLDDIESADESLSKIYSNYMHGPFGVWSDSMSLDDGTFNYLPAAASLLHAMIFGYAGIKIHNDRMEFTNPRYPSNTTGLFFYGLRYLDNWLSLEINNSTRKLTIKKLNTDNPIQVIRGEQKTTACQDCSYLIEYESDKYISLAPVRNLIGDCQLPEDIVGRSTFNPDVGIEESETTPDGGDGSGGGGSSSLGISLFLIFVVIINIFTS